MKVYAQEQAMKDSLVPTFALVTHLVSQFVDLFAVVSSNCELVDALVPLLELLTVALSHEQLFLF